MYMKKDNVIQQLNDVLQIIRDIDKPESGVIVDNLSTAKTKLAEVIHQLDTYKCFIDVRDEHPLGQDKTMRVDSPFNDGNPVQGVDDGHTS